MVTIYKTNSNSFARQNLQPTGIMAVRSQVPKFGDWENKDDVPYTVYFEKAKKGRKSKMNSEISDPSSNIEPSVESREEVDLRKSSDSSSQPRRNSRQSGGSVQSSDNSPLHPHHQARVGNKGSVSSESSYGAGSLTPGRTRLGQVTRGDENVDDGPAIPKFGGWDDSDPTSGEGYTEVFNKARHDKHTGGGKSPMITSETANFYGQRNEKSKCCGCFPWSRK